MIFLGILTIIIFCTIFTSIMIFFTDDSCLPYKRKMENMLDKIRIYQRNAEIPHIHFSYNGKTFDVGVMWSGSAYSYGHYDVFINGNHVMTWHILSHTFTKSRLEEHHGDMKASEEFEIIQATYKYAKKANDEWWDVKLHKPSYFD